MDKSIARTNGASDAAPDEQIELLRARLPKTMAALERTPDVELVRAAVGELFAMLDPLRGNAAEDIDETFGAGMSDLLRQEAIAPDGGLFQEGGLSAGGIFGDVPVATALTDAGAAARTETRREARLLAEAAPPRRLLERLKSRLLDPPELRDGAGRDEVAEAEPEDAAD